ncbi:hypothetical protein ATY76_15025 [Rhizobium sp. R339]|uniref:hypothetical protein n=1 Tax=Rhizobium sp. R339 TaxID=1764273 RepID=UPI000B6B4BF6|nr:hypothetical protein [Rhizobium sp. R339]OWV66956.1 hypothetical protein ATY76_15025 [Rhizobium sp. R339]
MSAMLSMTTMCSHATASEKTFGPFTVDDAKPDVIAMEGEIDVGSALNFRRALQAAPNAKLITLNSPGGAVQMGLLIADDIHEKSLQPTFQQTASACLLVLIYFLQVSSERSTAN